MPSLMNQDGEGNLLEKFCQNLRLSPSDRQFKNRLLANQERCSSLQYHKPKTDKNNKTKPQQ